MKALAATLSLVATTAFADPAVVTNVTTSQSGNSWRFNVAILHPDSGWDHYSDGWEVVTESGDILGKRLLAHPHENEQPFTRSVSGVVIPTSTRHVLIRTNCNVDGQTSVPYRVELE